MARCKYCGAEITWMKEGRKNVPVDADGGIHRCEEMLNMRNSLKTIKPSSLTPEEEIAKYEQAMNEKSKK